MTQQTSWTERLFLALVALLPLHTVYFHAWVAWKPWLVLLGVVATLDLVGSRGFPWHWRVALGATVFLASVLVSWPGPAAPDTFWRLWGGLAAGCLLLLVTGRHASDTGPLLRVAFWSGAAMAVTGFVFALATSGGLGEWAVDGINMIPGVDRINKPAYLGSGFVALTNWHQDPGYAALWSNVWLLLAGFAWIRGEVRGPTWLGPAVLGGLGAVTILTLSRAGWLGLIVAFTCLGAHARSDRRVALRLVLGSIVVMVALLGAQVILDREGVGGDWTASLEFRLSHLGVLGAIDLGEIGVEDPDLVVGDNRLEVWGEYWDRFLNQPLRGIGLGTGWAEEGLQEPHNLWLQVLAETGIVGLLGLAALLISLVVTAGKPDPLAGCVLLVVGLAALTQTVIFEPVLWLGLGLWLAHALKREAERPVLSVT